MTSSTSTRQSARKSVWKHGLAATLAAAAATTGIAYVASRAGVSFADPTRPELPPIPPLGFTELTVVFSLIGVGLAAIMARKARRPRSTFVLTTLALLALSVVPDFRAIPMLRIPDFDTATSFTLAGLHLVAAAIVIPTLAGRLATQR